MFSYGASAIVAGTVLEASVFAIPAASLALGYEKQRLEREDRVEQIESRFVREVWAEVNARFEGQESPAILWGFDPIFHEDV
jgi:hypothetical protein